MIDFGRALKAPFNDPDWISKTLLSFVWGLLGVIFFPLLAVFTGVQLEYIRRVSRGDERLPEWSNFGKSWTEGLVVWVAGFLYFLPVFALGAMALGPSIIAAIREQERLAGGLFAGSVCMFILVAVVYSIVVSIFYEAALVNYAMRGGFGSLFAIGEILGRVRGNSGYWAAWAYTVVISFGVSAVTSILSGTVVGVILYPAAFYLGTMMTGHVLGQWARQAYVGTTPTGFAPSVLRTDDANSSGWDTARPTHSAPVPPAIPTPPPPVSPPPPPPSRDLPEDR